LTGTPGHDRAAIRYHDIGVRIVDNEAGERGFEIWAGRRPSAARQGIGKADPQIYRDTSPAQLLRSESCACTQYGGPRDNKFTARIRILVNELGTGAITAWPWKGVGP
jgi:sulfite reductase (NADPH) hemoprotein beta-component